MRSESKLAKNTDKDLQNLRSFAQGVCVCTATINSLCTKQPCRNEVNMINVIGLGYIGLPTALMLAAHGNEVVGTDYNPDLVSELNHGNVTFEEQNLLELYQEAVKKHIKFTTDYHECGIYIIAVSTPYIKESKKIDTSYVVQAITNVLKVCKKGAVIIIESTVSPGTIDKSVRPLLLKYGYTAGTDIHLAHAPERIIPGNMIYELEYNSRTIGADSMEIAQIVQQIYATFCQGEIVLTDIRTAEMTKVVENTYRDINIAFANELMKICRSDDMDVYEIIKIANKHPRVNILTPGPGVGGHCISVDPWFLVGDYPGLANIILAARKINDGMPDFVLERIASILEEHQLTDISKIGLYGLTYKENVDDVRESPTLQLLENMKHHLADGRIQVYDPYIKHDIVKNQHHQLKAFLDSVDFVVIMVGHDEIKQNVSALDGKIVLDTRRICVRKEFYYL